MTWVRLGAAEFLPNGGVAGGELAEGGVMEADHIDLGRVVEAGREAAVEGGVAEHGADNRAGRGTVAIGIECAHDRNADGVIELAAAVVQRNEDDEGVVNGVDDVHLAELVFEALDGTFPSGVFPEPVEAAVNPVSEAALGGDMREADRNEAGELFFNEGSGDDGSEEHFAIDAVAFVGPMGVAPGELGGQGRVASGGVGPAVGADLGADPLAVGVAVAAAPFGSSIAFFAAGGVGKKVGGGVDFGGAEGADGDVLKPGATDLHPGNVAAVFFKGDQTDEGVKDVVVGLHMGDVFTVRGTEERDGIAIVDVA